MIGFAAETENLEKNARAKLKSKGCDWILANRVGPDGSGKEKTFGSPLNKIVFVSSSGIKEWPLADKKSVAVKLVRLIEDEFKA